MARFHDFYLLGLRSEIMSEIIAASLNIKLLSVNCDNVVFKKKIKTLNLTKKVLRTSKISSMHQDNFTQQDFLKFPEKNNFNLEVFHNLSCFNLVFSSFHKLLSSEIIFFTWTDNFTCFLLRFSVWSLF